MPKCKICGSKKAGTDKICWKCNPEDRRYKHGVHSEIHVTAKRDKKKLLTKVKDYWKR